ncbi:LysR substrate-binding domain-containing protein [Acinetobacter puyangensis]|uniref:LysR substrate-binding domain-containing protein n=1 Tax=Acinetobacter puyangensis TaxID=1096779 RepID=UPI003A4D4228
MAENLNDLKAFVVVAQLGSFTKAAGQLGISQSALSYTLKMLEQRLGIKLLNRTTRSVSPTQEGEQLLNDIEPLITGIEQKLYNLNEFRDSPQGKLRINGTELSINFLLWDRLAKFSHDHPKIQLELTTDYALSDIVKDRYDIGIRLGHLIDKDMIAIPVSEPLEMITVASPHYLKNCDIPKTPNDLHQHRCIGMRLPSHENIMTWEFKNIEKSNEVLHLRPDFVMIVSHARLKVKAALDGLGIAWLPKAMVESELLHGELVRLLQAWEMNYARYYIYYPNRRESSPLFRLLVDALKLY